jgi:hypothetical protein
MKNTLIFSLVFSALLAGPLISKAQMPTQTPTQTSAPSTATPTESKAPAQKPVSSSYKASVKELLKVTKVVENQESLIHEMAANLSKDAKDKEKAQKSTVTFFEKVIGIEAMLPEVAQAYAKHFSESELKKLIAFYKTPLGGKAVTEMPLVTRDIMAIAQAKMQIKMEEFKKDKAKMDGFN